MTRPRSPARLTARSESLRWSRRAALSAVAIAFVVLIALVGSSGGGGGHPGGGSAARPTTADTLPIPRLASSLGGQIVVPGRLPVLPWPKKGEAALALQGIGEIAASADQRRVPIASVTKVMTALVVLQDHPLPGDSGGPVFHMTKADAVDYVRDSANDDSSLFVRAGEAIDERQLLEGLLIPSADNVADYLARWDAGSVPAFVQKMNDEALAIGMTSTHYADASGLDPGSDSTASDEARLASVAMAIPAFASIVDNAYVDLPVSGRVWGYNPLIGVDGIVGVKSGFTQAAQGCLVIAARRSVSGHAVTVIAVVLGQPLGLGQAAQTDQSLLDTVAPHLGLFKVLRGGSGVALVSAPWSSSAVAARAGGDITIVGWPGMSLDVSLVPASGVLRSAVQSFLVGEQASHEPRPTVLLSQGVQIATLELAVDGTPQASVPVDLAVAIPAPPAGWHPAHR